MLVIALYIFKSLQINLLEANLLVVRPVRINRGLTRALPAT